MCKEYHTCTDASKNGEQKHYVVSDNDARIFKTSPMSMPLDDHTLSISIARHGRGLVVTRVTRPGTRPLLLVGPQQCLALERRWVEGPQSGVAIDLDHVDYDELDWNNIGPHQFGSLCWLSGLVYFFDAIEVSPTRCESYPIRQQTSMKYMSNTHVISSFQWLCKVYMNVCQTTRDALGPFVPIPDICDVIVSFLISPAVPVARQYISWFGTDPSAWYNSFYMDMDSPVVCSVPKKQHT